MKRILLLFSIILFIGLKVKAQYVPGPGVPSGSNPFSPTWRWKANGPDSLTKFWLGFGTKSFPIYTAPQINKLFNDNTLFFTNNFRLIADTIDLAHTIITDSSHFNKGMSVGSLIDSNRVHYKLFRQISGVGMTALLNINAVHGGGAQLQTDGPGRTSSIIVPYGRNWPEYVAQASTGLSYPILTSFLTDTAGIDTIPVLYHNVWYKQKLISGGGTTTNALTMNNSGSGDASGTTFDGSAARTLSYNTIGAQQALTLTTTGTSGAATLSAGTLNIPQYAGTTYTFTNGLTNTSGTVKLGGALTGATTVSAGASNTFVMNTISGSNTASTQLFNGTLKNTIAIASNGLAQSQYFASGSNPVAQLFYQNSSSVAKTLEYSPINKGAYFTDNIDNLGAQYGADYSTNQRLNQNAIPSVKAVIGIADSVKGTIPAVSGANPIASIGFTAVNGSNTTYLRSDGAPKADSTIIRSVANSYSLSGMQTKLNNYALTSSLPVGANPTATAGTSAVNGSATTFMRSDAAPKVDSTIFRTVANSYSLSGLQTKFNGYVPTSTTVAGFALSSNVTLAALSAGTGLTFSNYTGASAITAKADTSVLQTVLNFFPKGDTRYLKTATISGLANPTGTIGLTAVNGSATTAMRSDAAPALSQSIAPTWTGLHTFQQNNLVTTTADAIYLQNNTASTSGVPNQYSPSLHFGARVWNTTVTAADNWADWRIYNSTASGASPNTTLNFDYSTSTTSTPSYINQAKFDKFGLTLQGTLTVGAGMTVNGQLNTAGGMNNTQYNLFLGSGLNIATASASQLLYEGGSFNYFRAAIGSSQTTVTTVTSGNTYANLIIGAAPIALTASATPSWASQVVIKAPGTITLNSGTLSNQANLYVEAPGSSATNNYAIYVKGGNTNVAEFSTAFASKSANYTLTDNDHTILSSGTGTTITLPTAVGRLGVIYTIKRNDASNTQTVGTTSSQTIDGSTTYSLSADKKYVTVQSDNANWWIIANN